MKEEIGLKEILDNLRNLSANDLRIVQRQLTDVMYAKAIEDYLQATLPSKPVV